MAMPRPPPDLVDDAIAEILIRVSPDEPADLVRASLVCKLWRRLLSDPAFLSRYRRFHRTPPLLGFFHDVGFVQTNPGFVPTTAASSFHQSAFQCHPCLVFDCRHGRVLLRIVDTDRFVVWDPITGHREELRMPCIGDPWFSAAVLCAASDCDHRDCHGGPFTVVYAGTDVVYSSETSAWSMPVSVHIRSYSNIDDRGALVGNEIHFRPCLGNLNPYGLEWIGVENELNSLLIPLKPYGLECIV
ncbi:hypothetical protein QOZ80_7AG0554120 [Eleusine coracana subsp. coracana]|nr:hypothetical protein QOZ80_7AG0554120 [Eleusine coracana subsp. coracana]